MTRNMYPDLRGLCTRGPENLIMYALIRPTLTCTGVFFELGKMPKKIPPECEALVKEFSRGNFTVRALLEVPGRIEGGVFATLDEAWIYQANCNGKKRICYGKIRECAARMGCYPPGNERFNKFMVVGALTGRGVLPLHRVADKLKINAEYHIEKVLSSP